MGTREEVPGQPLSGTPINQSNLRPAQQPLAQAVQRREQRPLVCHPQAAHAAQRSVGGGRGGRAPCAAAMLLVVALHRLLWSRRGRL